MADFTVEIKGLEALRRKAQDGFAVPNGVETGIRKGSVIVEAAAKRNVHKRSRKLHDSTGHNIDGSGLDTRGIVGPRPGFGGPRGYTTTTGGQKYEIAGRVYIDSTRKKKRKHRAVNRSDPTEYGAYEELGTRYRPGHPWLVPALEDNKDRITNTVNREVAAALRKSVGKDKAG